MVLDLTVTAQRASQAPQQVSTGIVQRLTQEPVAVVLVATLQGRRATQVDMAVAVKSSLDIMEVNRGFTKEHCPNKLQQGY